MKPIDTRNNFFDVWDVYWPIALAVFLIVLGAVVFLGLRYRSRSREIPRGRDESTPLEVGYAVALACVAAFLVFLTFSRMPGSEDANATGKPVDIRVTAARWNWRFEYPELGFVEQGTRRHVPVLRVPVDTEVEFTGSSLDVIHSFFVPEERFKRDVFPGQQTRWEMVFDNPGNHVGGGECAEFCGLEHSNMNFDVLVMPKADFARWARGTS
ncbi:MAG: cytochrome c oxidase subunit II [Solirubrobacterales bacterium]